jgi:hypothetical protein
MLSTNPKHIMTVDDRSHFADLREGAMIPGYRGYVPKYKFHEGYTYGLGTEEMYKLRKQQAAEDAAKYGYTLPTQTENKCLPQMTRSRTLPPADGVNKLTEDMKPGYTGYVPRRPFIFGGTYKSECEECVDEFLNSKDKNTTAKISLDATVASYPKLHPITKESLVVKKLNHLRDHKEGAPAIAEDKRTGVEPPIPGYTGYVPRISVTEQGLGGRYHITSEKGYRDFFSNSLRHASNLGHDIDSASFNPQPQEIEHGASARRAPNMDRRLYTHTGMLPKYTGYLPHQPYAFGKTYGNMSRSLSVCGHDYPTYGLYKEDTRRMAAARSARA